MSTYDHYTTPVPPGTWDVPAAGATRFSWEYDNGRDRLLSLYQRGKDKQWDAAKRIDWSIPVDPANVMGMSEELNPIYGSAQWDKLSQAERDELAHHLSSWLFSQFLHGEQGALTVAARIVESVPDMDSKFYAATQAMDEARHVELFSRFMREKIDLYYPINDDLAKLLADALSDSRWDFPYLGMQVLIEGLALAAFGVHRDVATNPLVKQLLAFVMQDEARHVAFGRLALRDYYAQLTDAERADREEFVVEGCYLMRNRFRSQEVWERMGFDVAQCLEFTENSPVQQMFRTLLFSRIVPCVKDIGLWGPKVRHAYADLGVLDAAKSDLEALMRDDEQIAERMELQYAAEFAARTAEVDAAITEGSAADRGCRSGGAAGQMGGMDPLDSQLRFVLEADRLKSVLRRSTLNDGSRRENSAEHSWHLALMALVLGQHAPPGTDLGKVTAMVVLHDLVEIDAGDLYVYADETAQRRQAVAERAAADRLFGLLPSGQGTALRALWDEFEQRITPEARFARALDRLQPLMANYEAGGKTWQANGITADQVLARVRLIDDGSAELGQYARSLVSDAVRRGILLPAPA